MWHDVIKLVNLDGKYPSGQIDEKESIKMNKDIEIIIDKAEELGWTVTEFDGEYEFQKYSPEGQDFHMQLEGNSPQELIDNIYERYENFDVSYETYLWLDDTGHGRNGAPYDMRDLYNDMEACEQMMLDLYNELTK